MAATRDDVFDPIPAPVREVLTLFDAALAGVRFPDVDGDVLAGLAADVRARAEDVAQARAALARAREALEASQAALATKARKAVDYAQVYARDDEALAEALEALAVVQEGQPKRKTRRRKRKLPATAAVGVIAGPPELPLETEPRLKVAAG